MLTIPGLQTLHEYGCLPTYSSTHRQHRKLGDAAPQAANSSSGSSSRPPRPPPRSSCINPGLVHVRLIKQPTEIWETSANNLVGGESGSSTWAIVVKTCGVGCSPLAATESCSWERGRHGYHTGHIQQKQCAFPWVPSWLQGMRASVGRWWMLLQDDQLLLEEGWVL